jgi:hypothetical protein
MAIDFPFYYIQSGRRAGLHTFLFVTEYEYRKLGESRAKEIEYGRIRSKQVSADPAIKAKWSGRRAHRRKTEPVLRERENELRRRKTRSATMANLPPNYLGQN